MPLDSNLFVLLVRPRASESGWLDFIVDNSSQEVLYSAHKDSSSSIYTIYDPLTSASYGTLFHPPPSLPNATTPNPKLRTISLEHPKMETTLRNSGGLSWQWEFEWEETKYVWGRDVVGLLGSERGYTLSVSRKPDPNYPVVSFRPGKKGGSIEILDYNFARVEPAIQDKKGLEITFLLSLCFFIDHLFASSSPSTPAITPTPNATPVPPPSFSRPTPPVPLPPASPPTRQATRSRSLATNEIQVDSDSEEAVDRYCSKCLSLLEDAALMYLLLTPSTPQHAGTVVKLAEKVKRKRYKASGEEIKLFVDDGSDGEGSSETTKKGKKKGDYAPPTNLKIYLSRLELSELLPTHNRRKPSVAKPPIRPPINFDAPSPPPPSRPALPPSPQTATRQKLRKSGKEEESHANGKEGTALNGKKSSSWFGRT
ncbi:hypothetical protein JCM5353_007061 [Sporobolomyces roseus]